MIEIKFACPHCGQHIACDRDYAGMSILCPVCSQPMEVPRLSASEGPHPDVCLVASTLTPKRHPASRIPTIDVWTEDEWAEHSREAPVEAQPTPVWLVSALATIVAAALLKAAGGPGWAISVCLIAGTALSCYFLARKQFMANAAPGLTSGPGVASLLLSIGLLLLAIPAVALGVLFVGCVCAA
jgi:hypothetical protein